MYLIFFFSCMFLIIFTKRSYYIGYTYLIPIYYHFYNILFLFDVDLKLAEFIVNKVFTIHQKM